MLHISTGTVHIVAPVLRYRFESHVGHGLKSAVFCVVLVCEGRGFAMVRCPSKQSYGMIHTCRINSDSEQVIRHNS
jgi:hypothetical protein